MNPRIFTRAPSASGLLPPPPPTSLPHLLLVLSLSPSQPSGGERGLR